MEGLVLVILKVVNGLIRVNGVRDIFSAWAMEQYSLFVYVNWYVLYFRFVLGYCFLSLAIL